MSLLLRKRSRYRMIRSIYARGVTGNLSEPWNQGTLFQDSAGTTPVTAVEQGIGLELDNSYGGAIGPDLVINGGFDTDTSWNKGTGWTIGGGTANYDGTSAFSQLQSSDWSAVAPGEIGLITFTISNVGASVSSIRIVLGGNVGYGVVPVSGAGTYTARLLNVGVNAAFSVQSAGITGSAYAFSIDNASCRKLHGNHLIQATGAAEPVWKQDANGKFYKKFDGIDDNFTCATGGGSSTAFSLQMAVMLEGAAAAQTLFSDAGTNIGLKIERDASNQIVLSGGNGGTFVPATSAAQTVGAAAVLTCKYNGTLLYIRINRGTPVTAAVTLSAGTAGFTVGKANGAASSYFNGRMYGRAYFKNYLLTDAEENAGIEFLAAKAGISL